jgi:hypothetical protein
MSTPLRLALLSLALAVSSHAADYFIATDGKPDAAGTKESPWDIASAFEGKHPLLPGDTLWLRAGTYKHPNRTPGGQGFELKLAGDKDKPLHVRACPAERVTLDGGLTIAQPSTCLWVWDLEILVSENLTQERVSKEPGSHPKDLNRPWGGLNITAGTGCKYIDLVIHDNAQGVSFWSGAADSELHGCLIYDNGWKAPDRGHGHAIYTQNQNGIKTLSDNIMTGGYSYTMHAYGSKNAYVDNYLIEGNIAYAAGTFLIGGGRPSRGIRVLRNYLYGVSMQIGYNAPENEDCEVRGNTIVGGLSINKYKKVVNEDNLVLAMNEPHPKGELAVLRPNRYDPARANLIAFDWAKSPEMEVASDWLKDGETYRLMDPKDFFGQPIHQAVCQGRKITFPVKGEFAAYVLLATRGPASSAPK